MNQYLFNQHQSFHIQHHLTKNYISFIEIKGIFSKKQVLTLIKEPQQFQFESYAKNSNIYLGEIVQIKSNDQYINNGQLFCIQPSIDPFVTQTVNHFIVRFINNGRILTYENGAFSLTKKKTNESLWELKPFLNITYSTYPLITLAQTPIERQNDVYSIRNYWTGCYLHTHNIKYNNSGEYEISAQFPPSQDKWQILVEDKYFIKHMQSNRFIVSLSQIPTFTKSGLQITTIPKKSNQGWLIQTVDHPNGNLIYHPVLEMYLSQIEKPSETTTEHFEVALVNKISGLCVWIFDSIQY